MITLNIASLDSPRLREQEIIPPPPAPLSKFHNSRPPAREISEEKSQHRIAAYLIAGGAKPKEVAEELSVAPNTVYNWLRQPWFQATVNEILQDKFGGDITEMLKSAASAAVLVSMDLMQNSTSDQVRLKAAQDLLDRHRGKPTNFVHHTNHQLSEAPDKEIARLENELKLK